MDFDQYLSKIENILKKYYPIEDFNQISRILDPEDLQEYNKLTQALETSFDGKRELESFQSLMGGKFPYIIKKEEQTPYNGYYDDSDDLKWKSSTTIKTAKKAVDMCLYALEKGNLLQATKCLDIIEKCQDNFKNKDGSYNYGGEGYDEKIIAYIREKTNDFSLNKLNYTQAEDDLTWLVGDMIDKKIENIQQEISNLADTPLTKEVSEHLKGLQQEIIKLEKAFYRESDYEKKVNKGKEQEQEAFAPHKYSVDLTPEKEKELKLKMQEKLNAEMQKMLADDNHTEKDLDSKVK